MSLQSSSLQCVLHCGLLSSWAFAAPALRSTLGVSSPGVQSSSGGIELISPRASSLCRPARTCSFTSGRFSHATRASRRTKLSFSSSARMAARARTWSLRSSVMRALTSLPRRFRGIWSSSARGVAGERPGDGSPQAFELSGSSIIPVFRVDRRGQVCHNSPHHSGILRARTQRRPDTDAPVPSPALVPNFPNVPVSIFFINPLGRQGSSCEQPAGLIGQCGIYSRHNVTQCGHYAIIPFPVGRVRENTISPSIASELDTAVGQPPSQLPLGATNGLSSSLTDLPAHQPVELHNGVNA